MNERDLRIGNLIKFSEDGTIFKVGSIDEKGFTVQNEEETTWIESYEFEPIPLTEEWLIKMGFEKSVDTTNLFVKIENINEVQYEISFYEKVGCSLYAEEFWLKDEIKYVHQLQNLYYALTNEELTIKN